MLEITKLKLTAKATIKGESEERQPNIAGCCFMPGGELLLCDFWGHNIKLLDSSFSLKGSIENLKWGPTDVTALDNVTATKTCPCNIQRTCSAVEIESFGEKKMDIFNN